MSQRSKADLLPAEVRAELDARLLASAFSDYEGLASWLSEQGFEISKSALHRYGSREEERIRAMMDRVRASTQAALLIAGATPDEEDKRTEAVITIAQSGLLEVSMAFSELDATDPADLEKRADIYARLARATADLGRASVTQKRWANEIRGKIGKRLDAIEAEAKTGSAPRDPLELLRRVREEVYGLV